MRRLILFLLLTLIPAGYGENSDAMSMQFDIAQTDKLYLEMELDGLVDYTAFRQAMAGYGKIPHKKIS